MTSYRHAGRLYTGTTAERTALVLEAGITGAWFFDTDLAVMFYWSGSTWDYVIHGLAWDDLQINPANIRAPVSGSPTWTAYKSCEVPAFSKNQTNTLYFTAQMPHKWLLGDDITFHLHLAYPDNGAGNSRWQFTYSWANINSESFPTATTIADTFASPASTDNHQLASFGALSATGKTLSSILLCSISRLGADGADTYDNVIYMVSADFHYRSDAMGSRLITTKY